MSQNEGEPVKFIRDLKDKSSIIVFYEEPDYAKSLGFLFLDIGLRNGQMGLYISCDTIPDAEAGMVSAGINVASFKANNLRIHNMSNQKKDHITRTIGDFVKTAKNHTARIVVHHDRFTKEQQSDLLLIEEFIQSLFAKHNISVLNIYNTEFMDNAKFMQQIINVHDYTIFAPDFGKGIVVKIK